MSAWVALTISRGISDSWNPLAEPLTGASMNLTANLYIPFLWPSLFDATDVRDYVISDEEEDNETWQSFVLVTSVKDALSRAERLWKKASADAWCSEVWEGLEPMIQLLKKAKTDDQIVLDPYGVDAVATVEGSMRAAVAGSALAFEKLRKRWSAKNARALMPSEMRSDVAEAEKFVLEFSELDAARQAFFATCWGWPSHHEATATALQPWLEGEQDQEGLSADDPMVTQALNFLDLLLNNEAIEVSDITQLAVQIAPLLDHSVPQRSYQVYEVFMDSPHVEDVFLSEDDLRRILKRW
jgi:hypothetical protein